MDPRTAIAIALALSGEPSMPAVAPPVVRTVTVEVLTYSFRPPIGHTHTHCVTWDHAAHDGHDCPVCGRMVYVQDPTPRPVTVITRTRETVIQEK